MLRRLLVLLVVGRHGLGGHVEEVVRQRDDFSQLLEDVAASVATVERSVAADQVVGVGVGQRLGVFVVVLLLHLHELAQELLVVGHLQSERIAGVDLAQVQLVEGVDGRRRRLVLVLLAAQQRGERLEGLRRRADVGGGDERRRSGGWRRERGKGERWSHALEVHRLLALAEGRDHRLRVGHRRRRQRVDGLVLVLSGLKRNLGRHARLLLG